MQFTVRECLQFCTFPPDGALLQPPFPSRDLDIRNRFLDVNIT